MAWRGGRVVECTALEMRHRCKPIGGSNPSLSANGSKQVVDKYGFFLELARSVPKSVPKLPNVLPKSDQLGMGRAPSRKGSTRAGNIRLRCEP
jgi:hypothetical protein